MKSTKTIGITLLMLLITVLFSVSVLAPSIVYDSYEVEGTYEITADDDTCFKVKILNLNPPKVEVSDCVEAELGESCDTNNDCVSSLCESDICSVKKAGESCYSGLGDNAVPHNKWCASGNCAWLSQDFGASYYGCQGNAPEGGPCMDDDYCNSGLECENYVCVAGGEDCTDGKDNDDDGFQDCKDIDCAICPNWDNMVLLKQKGSGASNLGTHMNGNAACETLDLECDFVEHYKDNVWTQSGTKSCTTAKAALSGNYAYRAVCKEEAPVLAALGESCDTNNDCVSSLCESDICSVKKAGESCYSGLGDNAVPHNKWCASGNCAWLSQDFGASYYGCQGNAPEGGPCMDDDYCNSGLECENYVCVAGGEDCTDGKDNDDDGFQDCKDIDCAICPNWDNMVLLKQKGSGASNLGTHMNGNAACETLDLECDFVEHYKDNVWTQSGTKSCTTAKAALSGNYAYRAVCKEEVAAPSTETNCADGADEDFDGDIDCADKDCEEIDPSPCPIHCDTCNDECTQKGDGLYYCVKCVSDTHCSQGQECKDDVCVEKTPTCDDPDANLENPLTQKTTATSATGVTGTDACHPNDPQKVKEYTCVSNGIIQWSYKLCPSGTSCTGDAGACEAVTPAVCVEMPELMIAIGQWKSGSMSMPDLMIKIGLWKKGCE